nr:4486_t:CDS:2 [Entrophospora candida]
MEVELKQTSEWSKLEENTPISKISTKKSRWDETHSDAQIGVTPAGNLGLVTPTPDNLVPMTSEVRLWEKDLDTRNKSLSDEVLNATFPSTGYKILEPPSGYVPIRTLARKLMATSTPIVGEEIPGVGNLTFFKQEDKQHFGKLLKDKDESELPELGAGALFNQILPLLMSQNLKDQECHLLVKVIDCILYKLDALVRPYVHKILVVIGPLLIEEDYFARFEDREIISNLNKAAGLPKMISTVRADIEHVEEYVKYTTARVFSVVASAHGIPAVLPFLKAIC